MEARPRTQEGPCTSVIGFPKKLQANNHQAGRCGPLFSKLNRHLHVNRHFRNNLLRTVDRRRRRLYSLGRHSAPPLLLYTLQIKSLFPVAFPPRGKINVHTKRRRPSFFSGVYRITTHIIKLIKLTCSSATRCCFLLYFASKKDSVG